MLGRYNLDFAAKELKNRRGKYAISIGGIAFAVALLISPGKPVWQAML